MRDLAVAAVGAIGAALFAAALYAALELANAASAILLAFAVLFTLEAGAVSAWRRGRRERPDQRRRNLSRPPARRPSASPLATGDTPTRRPRRHAATMLDELWRALP